METSEARNITSNNKQQLEMNNETLEKMKQLRLFGMYDAFKTNLESSVKESLTTDQFISVLVASEWDDRRNRSVERTIRAAAFTALYDYGDSVKCVFGPTKTQDGKPDVQAGDMDIS
ncbi:ATP-binding protein, partial [Micromonospora sp. NPDC049151]|uniref:ATP-binding protein n=1 Tax=Micromonospora sp. NPDC049151 TaxID=3155648 RepID=UPI0033F7CA68